MVASTILGDVYGAPAKSSALCLSSRRMLILIFDGLLMGLGVVDGVDVGSEVSTIRIRAVKISF